MWGHVATCGDQSLHWYIRFQEEMRWSDRQADVSTIQVENCKHLMGGDDRIWWLLVAFSGLGIGLLSDKAV